MEEAPSDCHHKIIDEIYCHKLKVPAQNDDFDIYINHQIKKSAITTGGEDFTDVQRLRDMRVMEGLSPEV